MKKGLNLLGIALLLSSCNVGYEKLTPDLLNRTGLALGHDFYRIPTGNKKSVDISGLKGTLNEYEYTVFNPSSMKAAYDFKDVSFVFEYTTINYSNNKISHDKKNISGKISNDGEYKITFKCYVFGANECEFEFVSVEGFYKFE